MNGKELSNEIKSLLTSLQKSEVDFSTVMEVRQIYAAVYEMVNWMQESSKDIIPEGDQKTGAFGEAYIYEYLRKKCPKGKVQLQKNSNKGHDIVYSQSKRGKKIKAEVKAVSYFSKTRTISPIGDNWDELYLLFLDKDFIPIGVWLIDSSPKQKGSLSFKGGKLAQLKMKNPISKGSGSPCLFDIAQDKFTEFKSLVLSRYQQIG